MTTKTDGNRSFIWVLKQTTAWCNGKSMSLLQSPSRWSRKSSVEITWSNTLLKARSARAHCPGLCPSLESQQCLWATCFKCSTTLTLICFGLNSPKCHSLPSYTKCANLLVILVTLCWIHSLFPHVLLAVLNLESYILSQDSAEKRSLVCWVAGVVEVVAAAGGAGDYAMQASLRLLSKHSPLQSRLLLELTDGHSLM